LIWGDVVVGSGTGDNKISGGGGDDDLTGNGGAVVDNGAIEATATNN
jgi:hypothetical protein